ncbi:hypothetical protein L150_01792 [Candida albicans Ca529L]|nr:hypothetical protein L150_01792 [Candida albicans Ca529L]
MIRSTIAKSFHRFLTTNTPPSTASPPPSHFSNPKEIPEPFGTGPDPNAVYHQQHQQQQHTAPAPNTKSSQDGSIKEITALIAMFALAYIAIDNYTERIRLEKLHNETSAINLKALQIQQLNHQREKKQKDLTLLQERREIAKRDFKMSLHIAMLRKQLMDLGVSPIELDLAIKEFEKSVKLDNSIKNVTGQYLWLDDSSDLKQYLPDPMEYDKARKNK